MSKKDDKLVRSCTLSLLITSVCALLLCTVCLVSTTWAWIKVDARYEGTTITLSDKCEATEPQQTPPDEIPDEEAQTDQTQLEETQLEETQTEGAKTEDAQTEDTQAEQTEEIISE